MVCGTLRSIFAVVTLGLAYIGPFVLADHRANGGEPIATKESGRPNIVVVVFDDMGFSDLGCYGSEIRTPNVDRLAMKGLRFTRFYNASRCCPTRAALLTGLYPHQVGLAKNGRDLSRDAATIAELLRDGGYQTAMVGKWHLSETAPLGGKADGPRHMAWLNHQAEHGRPFADVGTYPVNRGFERHYGPIWGVVDYFDPFSLVEGTKAVEQVPKDYYLTDALGAKAAEYVRAMAKDERPFFLYLAHCAPHWPLHARPEDIARYRGHYRDGWEALHASRYRRQVEMGLVDSATHPLPPLTGRGPGWETLDEAGREREASLMAAHAAMIDRVDQGIGELVQTLKDTGRYDNTIILILSDNGASPERYINPGFDRASQTRDGRPIQYTGEFHPGPETTWGYLGPHWASAVNTPYRYWKATSFEGGCHSPLIVHWPAGLKAVRGSTTDRVEHVIDLMPTCLELAGTPYPDQYAGHSLKPQEGTSLAPILKGQAGPLPRTLYFEHEGGRAILDGDWKLVARAGEPWELYHISQDATETHNVADQEPKRVEAMVTRWNAWAERVGAEAPKRARVP
ncbi:arylsulfatase [Singulisphaera rosea]